MENIKEKFKENKIKIIFISIASIVFFLIVIYAISDLNGEKEKITEFEVPGAKDETIGTKSEGLGTDTISREREVDLNTIYQDTKKNEEKYAEDEKVIEKYRQKFNETNQRTENVSHTQSNTRRKINYNNYTNNHEKAHVIYVKKKSIENDENVNLIPNNITTKNEIKPRNINKGGFFKKTVKDKAKTNELNVYASVHTNQIIMNNQRVKFRTTKEFTYNGETYPVNTFIYGLAQIRPNRLIIKINKINQTDIKLDVFDSEDSEQGLYVLTPNLNASLQKELKKEGINDEDLSKIPFSKSLKSIFDKKVKEEKVQLINNFKVIIKISPDE